MKRRDDMCTRISIGCLTMINGWIGCSDCRTRMRQRCRWRQSKSIYIYRMKMFSENCKKKSTASSMNSFRWISIVCQLILVYETLIDIKIMMMFYIVCFCGNERISEWKWMFIYEHINMWRMHDVIEIDLAH